MELQNQQEINAYQQNYLNQLEQLAQDAAIAQAQIAKEASKHEFGVKFAYFLQLAMVKALDETYAEILQDLQNFINQFAQNSATKALELESNTAVAFPEFKPVTPSFPSFSQTLADARSKQSNLLKLNDVQVNSESDLLALSSLGVVIDDNNDANNHNGNNNNSY
ncbi:MAG: hypothetical protein QNJ32_25395 [Xenococcaceae cyanobacterium MO_167.B27]|nr:hypothetical protein [Xenococcaceae cyanobacterium MO_167.B27]